MADFPATVDLATLSSSDGFALTGVFANDYTGYSVTAAGDINGDGIGDFLIGGVATDNGPWGNAGAVYVVFGRAGLISSPVHLADLNGTNGFRVTTVEYNGFTGIDAHALGDVNGDGIDDIIVGARGADSASYADNRGSAFIIFGKNTAVSGAFTADVLPANLDGTVGFRINGTSNGDFLGRVATSAGDINGDGINDILVGSGSSSVAGANAGALYVLYGKAAGGFAPTIVAGAINAADGFLITEGIAGNAIGSSAAPAGDVNGDGIDDLVIGVKYADNLGRSNGGSAYVVYGRNDGSFGAALNLTTLNGTTGFRIDGALDNDNTGNDVSSAGDVNGDGIDDLLIGARAGSGVNTSAYVVFGRSGTVGATFDLATINGANGFRMIGGPGTTFVGYSVASAGDVNGDGIDDLIIGAPLADGLGRAGAGVSYVVYGRNTAVSGNFTATLDLTTLNGVNGFKIVGAVAGDRQGWSVGGAGDVNGDGYADIIVASRASDAGGTNTGTTYIIYGHAPPEPPVILTADPAGQTLTGGTGDDILTGGIGKDTLYGLAGDDRLDGGDNNDLIYGGDGNDILRGGEGGDTIFAGNGTDNLDGGGGADKLYGDDGNDIMVGAAGNDTLYGGADNDNLTGNSGNDYLDGGTGADTMTGGADNDVYIVDNTGDIVIEQPGEGSDIVRAFVSYTLTANVETLQLQGTANLDGTGNELANNLQGNSGNNTLSGGAGVDTINGNDGDDVIIGGVNNDLLRGGGGADTFVILQESMKAPVLENDIIYDFSTLEGDKLDLRLIDANINLAGDQAFTLVAALSHVAGQMTLTFSGTQTLLRLDIDGDGSADYQMKINGDVTHDSGGWLL